MRIDLGRLTFLRGAALAALVSFPLLPLAAFGEETDSANEPQATSTRPPLASVYHQAAAKGEVTAKSKDSDSSKRSNPAAQVQRHLRSTVGGNWNVLGPNRELLPSATPAHVRAAQPRQIGTPSPPVAPHRDDAGGPPAPPSQPPPPRQSAIPLSLGTATYLNRYQASRQGLNYSEFGGGTRTDGTLPGAVYAGGGYLSGAPLSNPYFPADGPVVAQRPFDYELTVSPTASLYNRYWPLLLERNEEGIYQLDAADIYFMLQDGY